jgi:outer membrane protein
MLNLKGIIYLFLIVLSVNLSASTKEISKEVEQQQANNKEQFGWFYGVFAKLESSPYQGVRNSSQVLPALGYKGERFNLTGPQASYQFFESNTLNTSAVIEYRSAGFDAQDSDFFTGMRKRQSSVFGGLNFSFKPNRWTYQLSYLKDLQSRSKGNDIKLSTSYFSNFGPVFLTPSIALNYLDRRYTDYYYGVRPGESKAGREAYNASSALNKSVGFTLATPIFFDGFTRLTFTQNFLDGSITKSPLITNNRYWNINFSFTRFF